MSVAAQAWAWRKRDVKPVTKLVLLALGKRHDSKEKRVITTLKDLKADTGLVVNSISNHLLILEELGYVKIHPQAGFGGANTYTLINLDESESRKLKKINPKIHAHKQPDEFGELHARMFNSLWEAYPRKRNKKNAERAFSKLPVTQKLFQEIMTDIRNRSLGEWSDQSPKYIPHFTTYLNGHRWEDEMELSDKQKFEGDDEYKKGL